MHLHSPKLPKDSFLGMLIDNIIGWAIVIALIALYRANEAMYLIPSHNGFYDWSY